MVCSLPDPLGFRPLTTETFGRYSSEDDLASSPRSISSSPDMPTYTSPLSTTPELPSSVLDGARETTIPLFADPNLSANEGLNLTLHSNHQIDATSHVPKVDDQSAMLPSSSGWFPALPGPSTAPPAGATSIRLQPPLQDAAGSNQHNRSGQQVGSASSEDITMEVAPIPQLPHRRLTAVRADTVRPASCTPRLQLKKVYQWTRRGYVSPRGRTVCTEEDGMVDYMDVDAELGTSRNAIQVDDEEVGRTLDPIKTMMEDVRRRLGNHAPATRFTVIDGVTRQLDGEDITMADVDTGSEGVQSGSETCYGGFERMTVDDVRRFNVRQ